jgi:hypothetical protein
LDPGQPQPSLSNPIFEVLLRLVRSDAKDQVFSMVGGVV